MNSSFLTRKVGVSLVVFFLLCLSCHLSSAQPSPHSLDSRIIPLIESPDVSEALWGIHILRARDGNVLCSFNAAKNFVPASNMKLVTAAAALDLLGPEFRFKTSVCSDAVLEEGVLKGALILKGAGDPHFSDRLYSPEGRRAWPEENPAALAALADQLSNQGIRRIEGTLVVDDTLFLYEPLGPEWGWDDLEWYYAAPVETLAVNENCIGIQIKPGRAAGLPALIEVTPGFAAAQFHNRIVTGKKGGKVSYSLQREAGKEEWSLYGEIPLGNEAVLERVAVADPAEYAGRLFQRALEQKGITLGGNVVTRHLLPEEVLEQGNPSPRKAARIRVQPSCAKILTSFESIPLEEILKFLVKNSDNLYAEMICRQLGLTDGGLGSRLETCAGLKSFLRKSGVAEFSGHLADGSGLSKSNLISPKVLTQLLDFMRTHASHTSFFNLLPIAGVDGTMKYRLTQSPAKGNIFAKTGSLNTASSLSGYAKTIRGEELIFSIMANNYSGEISKVRDVIDRICEVMVDDRDSSDTK